MRTIAWMLGLLLLGVPGVVNASVGLDDAESSLLDAADEPYCTDKDNSHGVGGQSVDCAYVCDANSKISISVTAVDEDATVSGETTCGGAGADCGPVKHECGSDSLSQHGALSEHPGAGECFGESAELIDSGLKVSCSSEPHEVDPPVPTKYCPIVIEPSPPNPEVCIRRPNPCPDSVGTTRSEASGPVVYINCQLRISSTVLTDAGAIADFARAIAGEPNLSRIDATQLMTGLRMSIAAAGANEDPTVRAFLATLIAEVGDKFEHGGNETVLLLHPHLIDPGQQFAWMDAQDLVDAFKATSVIMMFDGEAKGAICQTGLCTAFTPSVRVGDGRQLLTMAG